MQGHAIINLRAGTVLSLSPEETERLVRDGFAAAGHRIEVRLVPPDQLEAALDAAATAPGDLLVTGGGDGTVRSAAQRLTGSDKVLGVLPLGTVNRFARDLGMPLHLPEAVEALAAGRVVEVDVAEVNGRVYLCNSTLGLPSTFAQERQKLRGRRLLERLTGYWHALRTIIGTRRRIALAIDDGHGQHAVRALTVNVSNNLYAEEPSLFLHRPALDGGRLGLYISRHRSGLGLLWVLVRAALGIWREDPNVDAVAAERVVIHTRHRKVKVVNDGEIETLTPPLRYKLRRRALKVLRPEPG